MKNLYVILTASLMLATLPIALATHEGSCDGAPHDEGIAHPLSSGRYLFIDPLQPEKTGEWQDTNPVPGLQTSMCLSGSTLIYRADLHLTTLP